VLCEILALHSCERVALHEPQRPSCFIVRTQSTAAHPETHNKRRVAYLNSRLKISFYSDSATCVCIIYQRVDYFFILRMPTFAAQNLCHYHPL
jgi:hypothetical protein